MITITSTRDAAGTLLRFIAKNAARGFEVVCDLPKRSYEGGGHVLPLPASTADMLASFNDKELRDYLLCAWPALYSAPLSSSPELHALRLSDAEQALRDMGVEAEQRVGPFEQLLDELHGQKLRNEACVRERVHPRYWFQIRRITHQVRGYFENVGVAIADLQKGRLHTKLFPSPSANVLDLDRRLRSTLEEEYTALEREGRANGAHVPRLLRVLGAAAYAHPNSAVQPGPILAISTRGLVEDQLRQTYWEQVASRPSLCTEHIAILRNTVGLGRGHTPYRNHYSPAEDSDSLELCRDLRARGLMASNADESTFHLTSEGYADVLRITKVKNPPPLEEL